MTHAFRHKSGRMVVRRNDEWCVLAADGNAVIRRWPSREEAEAWCDERFGREPRRDVRALAGAVGEIRHATFRGTDHLVVPVVALVEGVITASNAGGPELALVSEFAHAVGTWNYRPVMLGHPQVDGVPVLASTPEILELHQVGHTFNALVDAGRLRIEAWIDPVRARALNDDAHELVDRLEAREMVEVSVGVMTDLEEAPGEYNGVSYECIWRRTAPDHVAMLREHERGACSVAMGCGAPRVAKESEVAESVVRALGVVPSNVSTKKAPRGTAWSAPSLRAFTSKAWPELSATEKRRIAGHFAWARTSPPASFGDLSLPHHRPSDGAVVFRGVAAALGRLNQTSMPSADKGKVRGHLEAHRAAFESEARAANAYDEFLVEEYEARQEVLMGHDADDDTVAGVEHAVALPSKRKWHEKLLDLISFRSGQAETEMSDQDLRRSLGETLKNLEPQFVFIEAVFPGESAVIYAIDPDPGGPAPLKMYRREYEVAESGAVTFPGEREQVRPVTRFEPVVTAAAEAIAPPAADQQSETPAARTAACGCGCHEKEDVMHRNATRIRALIEAENTPWTADDQAYLEGLTDDRLAAFEPKATAEEKPKPKPAVKAAQEDGTGGEPPPEEETVTAAPATTTTPAVAEPPKPKTEAEWEAEAPEPIRAMLRRQRAAEAVRRDQLLGALKDQDAYTAEELKALSLDVLERLARVAKASVPEPDYSGRAAARAATEGDPEAIPAPPDFAAKIRAMRGKGTAA